MFQTPIKIKNIGDTGHFLQRFKWDHAVNFWEKFMEF